MKIAVPSQLTVLALGLTASALSLCTSLSIPSANDTERAATVNTTSYEIANVAREFLVGSTYYPLNPGPAMAIPSLYYSTLLSQVAVITELENPNVTTIATTLASLGPYDTLESFKAGYDALESAGLIDTPQAFDNSDENFGAMRLGIRGYQLSLVGPGE
ncbi:hypothetical protein BBJ28_00022221, partial [Nothophytophthora sp. Chile5]